MINMDERGFACPLPVVHVKKAIEEAKEGDEILVKVNDNVKLENIKRLCSSKGCKFSVKENAKDDMDIRIIVSHAAPVKADVSEEAGSICSLPKGGKMVAVVSADIMGTGDETLGRNLLKAFMFALTKQDSLPDVMLFYNRGAFVTCEGSECLESLKELEAAGVRIMTCGTCLDYYKMKEKLAVGLITNMYDIVCEMETAAKVIRP